MPPLWKDVDAYNQTVRPPGLVTILLHGPLYCTLSRVPLWFGYLISGSGPALCWPFHKALTAYRRWRVFTGRFTAYCVMVRRCLFDLRDRENVATALVVYGFIRQSAPVLRLCALCRLGSAKHDRNFASGRKRRPPHASLPRC